MTREGMHPILQSVLQYDVIFSKQLLGLLLKFAPFKTLKTYSAYLEASCHGILWLSGSLALIWLLDSDDLYEVQVNLLIGLILDIILIAIIKAICRRRRPTSSHKSFFYGPDKFSFPSGHASRAFLITMFFIYLNPAPTIMWPSILVWASSVTLSRLLSERHFFLDICAGALIGILEGCFLKLIWLNRGQAKTLVKLITSDELHNPDD